MSAVPPLPFPADMVDKSDMQSKYCDEMKHNVFHYIRNENEEKEV